MKLAIEDGDGKGRITLDAHANEIVIEALEGDVCFQAPNGDMQIVAQSVELKATNNDVASCVETLLPGWKFTAPNKPTRFELVLDLVIG